MLMIFSSLTFDTHVNNFKIDSWMEQPSCFSSVVRERYQRQDHSGSIKHVYLLSNREITPDKVAQFIKAIDEHEKQLGEKNTLLRLFLNDNPLGDLGCLHISSSIRWCNIEQLQLCDSMIGPQGCKYLSRMNWDNLYDIKLYHNKIGSVGAWYLAKGKWPKLGQLDLYGTSLGDRGCKQIAKGSWPLLTSLTMSSNYISDKGCLFLSKGLFPSLQTLYFYSNRFTPKGLSFIGKIPNTCEILCEDEVFGPVEWFDYEQDDQQGVEITLEPLERMKNHQEKERI